MTDRNEPRDGELLRLTLDRLRAAGVPVSQPPDALDLAVIEADGARWLFGVCDNGEAELIYRPAEPGDPRWLADLATVLLTGRPVLAERDPLPARRGELSTKSAVGVDLRHRGFDVELEVHTDDLFFEVSAEVVATDPDSPDEAVVGVGDRGFLTLRRDFGERHAVDDPANPGYLWLPDLPPVADDIAELVTTVVGCGERRPRPA